MAARRTPNGGSDSIGREGVRCNQRTMYMERKEQGVEAGGKERTPGATSAGKLEGRLQDDDRLLEQRIDDEKAEAEEERMMERKGGM